MDKIYYMLFIGLLAGIGHRGTTIFRKMRRKNSPLLLSDFTESREIKDDTWNKIKNGRGVFNIFCKNGNNVGNINYINTTGQIGIFWLEK